MLMLLRHLFAVAALPFVMTVVVPVWLARRDHVSLGPAATLPLLFVQLAGLALIVVGILLFASTLRRFATEGKGTLAPWDPPRKLVVHGPYRYVRNPMISGVLIIILGEALVLLSKSHFWWFLTFFAINAVYIPLLEEPMLQSRFGDSYTEYRRHVPRLIPRFTPWQPKASQ
jgi:protein-S-isoprenylcysteine O-methyltransferase Ste14